MSYSVIDRIFKGFIIPLFKERKYNYDPHHVMTGIAALCIASAIHTVYSSIITEKTITVARKIMIHTLEGTTFIIVDTNGNHYAIPTSIRHWQWNVLELYDSFREGMECEIKYFGMRIPALGAFPCIVGGPRTVYHGPLISILVPAGYCSSLITLRTPGELSIVE